MKEDLLKGKKYGGHDLKRGHREGYNLPPALKAKVSGRGASSFVGPTTATSPLCAATN